MAGPPTGTPTSTVTFLFTDIQGSTSMWEQDARRMQAALARHDEIMHDVVTEHGGHVFKMVGDACCAAFASAGDALRAALAAQRAIFSESWDDRVRVRVRMALHTGEAEERDGDYFGPPLNRVARLLSAGHGGQTLLSRATRELVEDHLPEQVSLRDMGERRLKDLKEPERIFQVLAPDLPSEFPPLKTLETSSNEDRYRLIKQIGSGGMAEVYLAYDEFLQREVAFKVLDRKYAENKEAIERFRREARNAASLHHPNIVATHDRGETEHGTYYIVMEYLEGGTLEDLIEREGSLPPREAVEIALEIAGALQAAHESGVIHRDIKPLNILLTKTGEAKVADFGIARAASATTMTQAGSILGTVHYISPEQALGEPATPQGDLYSLGVVLYEMLTGELPYDAETPVGVVMQHVGGISRSPKETDPEVPEELDAVTARLLAKDTDDRYPDAIVLLEDLERVKEGLPLDAATRERRQAKKPGRGFQRRGVLAALALVLVSIGVITIMGLVQGVGPLAPAKPLPQPQPGSLSAPLPSGRYATRDFDLGLSFRVDGGGRWRMAGHEQSDILELTTAQSSEAFARQHTSLGFTLPNGVFGPNSQSGVSNERITPMPDDLVAWLRNHPNLKTSKPESVTVGGVSGTRLDVSVTSTPKDYSPACLTGPCVVILSYAVSGGDLRLFTGDKARMIVLKDVEGKTVVVIASTRAEEFERFMPKAQEVLDTV